MMRSSPSNGHFVIRDKTAANSALISTRPQGGRSRPELNLQLWRLSIAGIDFGHRDLAGNQWTNSSPGPEGDVHGWDYIADDGVIKDEQGHGTAVAGIIAAQGNNGAGISGVMWQAGIMSLRVLDNTGTGDIADAVEAIDYAVAHSQ